MLQLAAGGAAELRGGPSTIMGGDTGDAGCGGVRPEQLPDDFLGKTLAHGLVAAIHGPEYVSGGHFGQGAPGVNRHLHPDRHRHGADKAVQQYLAKRQYPNVVALCMERPRNNVGAWPTRTIVPGLLVLANHALANRADEKGRPDVAQAPPATNELFQGKKAVFQRCGRGAEQQSQSDLEKIVWLSYLPRPGTRALSHPWQTTRAGAHPRILLTSLQNWDSYTANADRRWLQQLVEALLTTDGS